MKSRKEGRPDEERYIRGVSCSPWIVQKMGLFALATVFLDPG